MTTATTKKPKAIKGVYENPVGSGIWWINYYVEGRRHREKVGRRSDAISLYQRRKTGARMGIKMPEVRPRRSVLFEEIASDALVYSKEHKASYPGDKSTVAKLLPVFGKIPIDDVTPQAIKSYLDTRDDLTKTTINRYRGTLSMIFQEAIRHGTAKVNPARLCVSTARTTVGFALLPTPKRPSSEESSARGVRRMNLSLLWPSKLECGAASCIHLNGSSRSGAQTVDPSEN